MRYVRGIVGVVVLVALGFVLRTWWTDYQAASALHVTKEESRIASSTAASTSTPSSLASGKGSGRVYTPATITKGEKVVIVLINGLSLREKPEADAKAITALKKDDSLTLLSTKKDGWYEVRSSKFGKGWISANPSYTEVKER